MLLIHLLQRSAALIPARDAALVVVLVAALGAAVSAYVRAPNALQRHRLALGGVALAAVAQLIAPRVVVPTTVLVAIFLAVVGAFTVHTVGEGRSGGKPSVENHWSRGQTVAWIGGAVALLALFIFPGLGGYAGSLMVWEPESMRGLLEATKNNISWPQFAVSRLFWGQGLMSTGSDSFLYGSGTYALWKIAGASSVTLRLTAALLGIACLPLAYKLGQRIGGAPVARVMVVVIALNPVFIYYGRYGVALSATLFGSMLLMLFCLQMLGPQRSGWWVGLAAAGAALLATLGYAPGRILALAVVATTLLLGVIFRRQLTSNRLAFALMVAALGGVWLLQVFFNTPRDFVDVRGEQILSVAPRPDWVQQVLGDEVDPANLTLQQRASMARRLIAERLSQLRAVYSCSFQEPKSPWDVIRRDPPHLPLIQGLFLIFAVWGFIRSFVEWRRVWPLLLPAVMVAVSLPLFLTNRLDIHRISLSSLPWIMWAALGIAATHRVMRECRVSRLQHGILAAAVVALLAAENSTNLFYPHPKPRSHLAPAIHKAIESVREPLAVGVVGNHLAAGEIEMVLVNRQRRDIGLPGDLLGGKTVKELTDEDGPDGTTVVQIEGLLHQSTVILAPLKPFTPAIRDLQARGMRAQVIDEDGVEMWRLDRLPTRGYLSSDEGRRPPPDDSRPKEQRATSPRSTRQKLSITEADVLEVYHGFEAPRFLTSEFGGAIAMRKADFGFGILMNAWTHMLFKVPNGALVMEAVIGLSNAAARCDHALATFEVWGEDNRRIFESPPMAADTPPRRIQVPLGYNSTITLVMTEAGNGSDCDDGIWAEPTFVFRR